MALPLSSKHLGKDPPWDMLYYTKKLSAIPGQSAVGDSETPSAHDPATQIGAVTCGEGDPSEGARDMDADSDNGGMDDSLQPTLGDILQAVQKCTASLDDLKKWLGGLGEEVSLLRQDLQKKKGSARLQLKAESVI